VNTLAIDIGGTKLAVALFAGQRMARREVRPTDREAGREGTLRQVEEIVLDWARETPIARCGIGFGGPVDFERQRVALSTHVSGWQDFPLPEHVQQFLNVPVVMDNDANVGALGESSYGAGQGALPLFYMTLSTGIGGGVILEDGLEDSRLYRGAENWAGEIGHLTIRPEGPECLCGARGCLERMCCGLWLERDYGRSPRELMQDAAFVDRYVVDLAQGLKCAVMLLNPARIVIGGGIANAGDALFVPLRRELRRQVTAWSRARLDVVQAQLGEDSVLWGALALAETCV
jgi:glucokinase